MEPFDNWDEDDWNGQIKSKYSTKKPNNSKLTTTRPPKRKSLSTKTTTTTTTSTKAPLKKSSSTKKTTPDTKTVFSTRQIRVETTTTTESNIDYQDENSSKNSIEVSNPMIKNEKISQDEEASLLDPQAIANQFSENEPSNHSNASVQLPNYETVEPSAQDQASYQSYITNLCAPLLKKITDTIGLNKPIEATPNQPQSPVAKNPPVANIYFTVFACLVTSQEKN